MKKIFLTFGIALLGFTAVFAQDAQDSDTYQPTDTEATETEAIESETDVTETEAPASDADVTETETEATGTETDAMKNEEELNSEEPAAPIAE